MSTNIQYPNCQIKTSLGFWHLDPKFVQDLDILIQDL